MKLFLFPLAATCLLLNSCGSNTTSSSPTTGMATDSTSGATAMGDSSSKMAATPMADSSKMMATADPTGPTAPHANDTEFMQSAAHSDQNEIQFSKMALAKGVSEPVKGYANKMIADHTKSTANLKPIAMKAGVTLPMDMDADHKAMAPMMEKLSGKAFETKYVQQMVADHQKTVNTLKAHETMTKNTGLQNWITTTLPVVESHLSMAKQDNKMAM